MQFNTSALAVSGFSVTVAGIALMLATPAGACSESQCLGTSVQANMARQAWQANQDNLHAQQQAMMDQQNASLGNFPPAPGAHAVFVTHPDADDIWVAAMYPSIAAARQRAMGACYEVMGDGCEWTWQAGRGHYGAVRAPDGRVFEALGDSKKEVTQQLNAWCEVYELGCIKLGIFNARSEFRKRPFRGDNVRSPENLAAVRKLYAAAAWLDADSFDGRTWIASGYATAKQAQDVALNACNLRANNNKPCSVAITTGNGVLVSFSLGNGLQRVLVDQTEERARAAIGKFCSREKFTCKVHHVYDARSSGVFENKL